MVPNLKSPSGCRSRFSSVGRASGSQIFWEHEFKSQQPHLCNSMWGQDRLRTSCQEVGKCSTRGGSRGILLHSPLQKVNKAEPTLALNPRGDITRNPKQGYQWPPKRTCVSAKKKKKKKVPVWTGYGGSACGRDLGHYRSKRSLRRSHFALWTMGFGGAEVTALTLAWSVMLGPA